MKMITLRDAPHTSYHIAEQAVVRGLEHWRKTPYCHNGGMNLSRWLLVDVDPTEINAVQVCGVCRTRLEAAHIFIAFGSQHYDPDAAIDTIRRQFDATIETAAQLGLTREQIADLFLDILEPLRAWS